MIRVHGTRRFAARAGEPVVRVAVRQAMKVMAEQFVLGRTINEAVARSGTAEQKAYRHSYDMLGEAAVTAADAARYLASYRGRDRRNRRIGARIGTVGVRATVDLGQAVGAASAVRVSTAGSRARRTCARGDLARARRKVAADRHDDRRGGSGTPGAVARVVRARSARSRGARRGRPRHSASHCSAAASGSSRSPRRGSTRASPR